MYTNHPPGNMKQLNAINQTNQIDYKFVASFFVEQSPRTQTRQLLVYEFNPGLTLPSIFTR